MPNICVIPGCGGTIVAHTTQNGKPLQTPYDTNALMGVMQERNPPPETGYHCSKCGITYYFLSKNNSESVQTE